MFLLLASKEIFSLYTALFRHSCEGVSLPQRMLHAVETLGAQGATVA